MATSSAKLFDHGTEFYFCFILQIFVCDEDKLLHHEYEFIHAYLEGIAKNIFDWEYSSTFDVELSWAD